MHTVTEERVDELLSFLPQFEALDRSYVKTWSGGEGTPGGAITFPYPVYEDDVVEFFCLAGQPWWSDYDYNPREAARKLYNDEFIRNCSLDDLRTMLTYCVRGERFADGHWAAVLEDGRIVALLHRLAKISRDMFAAPVGGSEERDAAREQHNENSG